MVVWDIRSSKPQCLWGNCRDLEPFTICKAIWRSSEGGLAVRHRVMPQTAAVCAQRRGGSSERRSRWSLGRTWRFRRLCNERHASEVHKPDMCNNSFRPVFMWDGAGKVFGSGKQFQNWQGAYIILESGLVVPLILKLRQATAQKQCCVSKKTWWKENEMWIILLILQNATIKKC